ncbi:hypothetical protein L6452_27533 [Arctium lappa]|uniref:Uncharacterized protein n=1 Tax=Arctium lappa TaxID=4217 RepID=A0ACB8ZWX6_ARCLA|nr:hypothetical protein L6452_27533 [Arctium lappa]
MIEKTRSIASPEQTASGKDLSSPLTPVAFAKSQQEGSSSSSLDSLNLRPNGEIQIPLKPKVNTLVHSQECSSTKAYYVLFNGPKAGIYTSWNIAEQAVKGIYGVKHKKYNSYDKARVSANIYTAAEEKDSKVKLGTIPKKTQHATQKLLEDMEDYDLEATYTGFKYLYKKGRETTELSFVEEHYYTSDKRNISYFNYFPNAHPEFILEAYQYGLLKMIYPSDNLLELSKFPVEFRNVVKTYKKKCLKGSDREIFLKVQSSLIFWDDNEEPNQNIQEVAEQKLLTLISKVFDISKEDKLKFERENLMSPGDKVFSITYLVAYALTNSHHSVDYKKSEYIKIEDVFSEIGVIEEKQFSSISPLDNSWAIDIAKNKPILDQKPRMSFRNNHREIGESSNRRYEPLSIRELSQRDTLHSVSRRVGDLCEKLELVG